LHSPGVSTILGGGLKFMITFSSSVLLVFSPNEEGCVFICACLRDFSKLRAHTFYRDLFCLE